jgi:hypothetical protein
VAMKDVGGTEPAVGPLHSARRRRLSLCGSALARAVAWRPTWTQLSGGEAEAIKAGRQRWWAAIQSVAAAKTV